MKDRIILLIKAKNLTAAQFADQIGVQKSSISHIISGRNNASLDFIQKILLTYPEVNMDWLLFGKGPIFKGSETIVNANSDKTLSSVSPPVSAPVDLFSEFVPGTSPDFRKENNFIPEQTSDESIPKDTIIEKTVREGLVQICPLSRDRYLKKAIAAQFYRYLEGIFPSNLAIYPNSNHWLGKQRPNSDRCQ